MAMEDYEEAWQWHCRGCGKIGHMTRRAAKRAGKLLHEHGMRAYRCPRAKGWHVGHNPLPVRRGMYTRDEWYALPRWMQDRALKRLERGDDDMAGAGRSVADPDAGAAGALRTEPARPGRGDGHDAVNGVAGLQRPTPGHAAVDAGPSGDRVAA